MKIPLEKLLKPPSFEDPDDAYVARLVHAIALTVLAVMAALALNNLLVGQGLASMTSVLAVASAAFVLLLLRLGQLRLASAAAPTLFLLFLTANVVGSYGIHDIAVIGFPGVIVLAGLLLGVRALFAFAFVTIGVLTAVYLLEVRGHIPGAFVEATDLSDLVNMAALLLMTTVLLRLLVGNLHASLERSGLARREQQRLIAELEAKNAELERFAYTVSHDLKTPLVTISNFLGYVVPSAEKGDLERLRRDVQRIGGAAGSMAALLDDLLELSRIGFVIQAPSEAPFGELAREAVARVAGPIEERGVRVEIAPDLPPVYGDRERLIEVLQNLLENAVKFMGDEPRPRIEIGARAGGDLDGGTVFFVRDNGIGIEAQYHERVFELFRRLDPSFADGTGLGLTLARRIIEAHHGRIWLESRGAGTGTTFCFSLPPRESS